MTTIIGQDPGLLQPQAEAVLTEEIIRSYENNDRYADVIAPILTLVDEFNAPEYVYSSEDCYSKHPGYLGSGGDKHAFLVEGPDGLVVVKVIRSLKDSPYTNAHSSELPETFTLRKTVASMAPLVRGKDKPRLEQLLSANCATGILITTPADGTRLNDMKDWELFKISRQHLVDLQATIDTMKGIGLHPHNVGGVFFDEKIGFNFVDYEIDDNEPNGMLNKLNIATLEDFVYGALADWNRLQQYAILRDLRLRPSAEDFKTTGLRALARVVIMRKAAKLAQT